MTEHQADGTHGPDGTYIPTTATARRDAEMADMRDRGASFRKIAAHFDVSVSTAHEGVDRAMRAIRAESGERVRQFELSRLDRYAAKVEAELDRERPVISHGRVVRRRLLDENGAFVILSTNEDGEPSYAEEEVSDASPLFQAVDRLLKIQERRARLLGLDSPVKQEISGQLTYEIVGVEPEDL